MCLCFFVVVVDVFLICVGLWGVYLINHWFYYCCCYLYYCYYMKGGRLGTGLTYLFSNNTWVFFLVKTIILTSYCICFLNVIFCFVYLISSLSPFVKCSLILARSINFLLLLFIFFKFGCLRHVVLCYDLEYLWGFFWIKFDCKYDQS